MTKKIIVFGASGDTGQYFVKYFLERYAGDEYQNIATGTRETHYFEQFKVPYYRVDITKKEEFSKLPNDVYTVVDLAGAMPARMKGYNPYKYFDVNIIGNLNIFEYCIVNNIDRILIVQSFGDITDYGEHNPLLTADLPREFSFTKDHTIYVMSKNFAVDMIENYHQMYGLKRFIFRLPTIYLYSPVDTFYVDGVQRKIGYRLLIDKAKSGEPIEVWDDFSRVKDMVYVKDFCQMLYKELFVDKPCGYYNVGTGVGISLLNQIKGVIKIFCEDGRKSEIIMRSDKPNAPQYVMDITPEVGEFRYKLQYNYLDMLRDFKNEMQRAETIGGGYSKVNSIYVALQIGRAA